MQDPNEGTAGIGAGGYSKYDAANAPTVDNGGNDQTQGDGNMTEQSPESMYGGAKGSLSN